MELRWESPRSRTKPWGVATSPRRSSARPRRSREPARRGARDESARSPPPATRTSTHRPAQVRSELPPKDETKGLPRPRPRRKRIALNDARKPPSERTRRAGTMPAAPLRRRPAQIRYDEWSSKSSASGPARAPRSRTVFGGASDSGTRDAIRTSSPGKTFAAGTVIVGRVESVGTLGAAANVFRSQHGAREMAGPSVFGRSTGQQHAGTLFCIQGQTR